MIRAHGETGKAPFCDAPVMPMNENVRSAIPGRKFTFRTKVAPFLAQDGSFDFSVYDPLANLQEVSNKIRFPPSAKGMMCSSPNLLMPASNLFRRSKMQCRTDG
jgi:hypothetical protein